MKKLLLFLFMLSMASLACSGSILKPAANFSESVSTETALPPTRMLEPVSTETQSATPTAATCIVTAAESLHLRDGPGLDGTVIAWLGPGDELILLPDPPAGDWVKVQFGKLTGWIHSHYCER